MTHYGVLVALPKRTKNIDRAIENVLAPFDENIEVEPYVRHTVADIKAGRIETIKTVKENILKAEAENPQTEHSKEWLKSSKPYLANLEKMSDEEYYHDQTEGSTLNEDGDEMSTYNPQSKWDWYTVGGRWNGSIPLKDGSTSNQTTVREANFEPTEESIAGAKKKYKRYQKLAKEAENPGPNKKKKDPDFDFIFSDFDPSISEADFIKQETSFATYAFVDKNGEWKQRAECGWWGSEHDATEDRYSWSVKFKERFIDPLDPGDILVVVDCHI